MFIGDFTLKIAFWLLDVNVNIDDETVELWLWGIDAAGNRVLVVDRNFTAYFYAVIEDGFDASKVAQAIMKDFAQSIAKVDVVERRFFGKSVQAVKVYCRVATETGKLANQLRTFEGVKDCLEDDIRAGMRYLIDNNLAPCNWHMVDVTEEENSVGVRVAKVYCANAPPRQLDKIEVPSLLVLGFFMICYSREGSPRPDRNPVLIISTVASNGEERQFVIDEDKNDVSLIQQFIGYIRQFDPDIITSYGGNTVDWTYLRNRSHQLGMKLDFDRASSEPHTSVYGHVSTTGIINIDLADFMDVFPEVKVKTLWNFADHLGVMRQAQPFVEDVEFADYWDDSQKREELKRFGLISARKVYGAAELLLDFAMQLSSLTSLPLDHVMTAAVGFRVEWFLIKRAQRIGELIPKRIEQPYRTYAGGLVLSPKPGLHENIAVLDFKSMYPNIMLTYNLSPDTYLALGEPEPASGVYTAPEVGHRFRKAPPGFYKEALRYLISVRNAIRQRMKGLDSKTIEYRVLDARQKAVKVITNASYGYAGWIGAKWYIKPVAEAASAWGRHTIQTAISMAKKAGIAVIYGDTDSLFISYEKEKTQRLQSDILHELKLETEVGEMYKRIFFTEAKKRYAGLRLDGSLDIVGLEVIRGDWAEVAKKVQEHVLEIILKEESPKKAIEYVHATIHDLIHRKVPFRDLIIWKTLTKPPEDYAVHAPHVEAAKVLKEKGWRLTGGDKVGYVVLQGKGRLFSRVKPYVFAEYDEIDTAYYVTHQVLPAAARILAFFSVTEAELLREKRETREVRSLTDYV
jgi:DNA polymerase I